MESKSEVFNTLNLIASLSLGRSINRSSESNKRSRKRKNNSSDHLPKKQKRKEIVFSTTIDLPTQMRDRIVEIGGYDIEIVIQKQLQDTDVNKNQGRLLIPIKKLVNEFVTEEEKKFLSQKDEDQKYKNGMKVLIIDPLLRESVIGLKMWKIGSGETYCLVSEWNSLVQQHSLESGDYIQLWSFRKNGFVTEAEITETVTSNLCFLIVKLDISEGIFKFI